MPNKPTDNLWPRAFEPEIHRRTKDDLCAWKFHCRSGSALKDVIFALEGFAKLNPERLVFGDIDKITERCNGRFRKGGRHRYHYRSVEDIMNVLRAQRALSPYGNFLVNTDSGRVWRRGWIFAPHDFLFRRHGRKCSFVGFDNALAARGFPALRWRRSPCIWIPEYAVEKDGNSVAGLCP
jgi:hypothetical protein